MVRVCSKCGTDNRDDSKFCRGCGTPLGVDATSAAATVPVSTPAPPVQRTVRDICGSGGGISQSVCESRQCGLPAHTGEALCKQVRDAEQRRRGVPQ